MSDPVELWLARLQASVIYAELDEIREAVAGRVILLPVGLSATEERWRTMHALGHMTLHCGNQRWMLRNGLELIVARHERQADEWAAVRLVPADELQRALYQGMEGEQLVEHFGVPEEGMRIALAILAATQQRGQVQVESEPEVGWQPQRPPWPRCAFCNDWAQGKFQTRAQGLCMPPGWVMKTPLCSKHELVMFRAGERGRVHAATGIRYWLLGE